MGDLVGDFVVGIFGILETIGKVGMNGTHWRSFGITVRSMGSVGSGMMGSGSGMMGGGVGWRVGSGSKGQSYGNDHGSNLKKLKTSNQGT